MSINNYYYTNRDKVLIRAAEYYMENKEYINKRSKLYFQKYYEKNKERIMNNIKKKKELQPKKPRKQRARKIKEKKIRIRKPKKKTENEIFELDKNVEINFSEI